MYLGIDIGTISVKVAGVDADGRLRLLKGPARHEGRPAKALAGMLAELAAENVEAAVATGAGRRWTASALDIQAVNGLRALSRAFARLYPDVRTIFEIGGHDSKLVAMRRMRSGEEPVAVDASRSSHCAAGTGSFLDQQALRLGYKPEELGEIAMRSQRPANVSGRCSVFAKTDLIHLQQIGTRDYDMLAGLCYAVVRTFRSSVAKGRRIEKPVALCGGVALNRCVARAVGEIFELAAGEFLAPEHPEFMAAIGCALLAAEGGGARKAVTFAADALERLQQHAELAATANRLPRLERPSHPATKERQYQPLPEGTRTRVYMGVDIGSVSTKAALITEDGRVAASRYFWTAGRPIEAVRRAMREIGDEAGERVEVAGVGATGSGRYLIGDFIGADIVKNEITAQATAAIAYDADVDTVFEIGGQDSKFIVIRNGAVVDFEMNKVCAAGTGSFLNEQAERMGISIEREFSELAFAAGEPVDCGERCTVFMETDVSNYLASGVSVPDLAAGLARSIAKNYLSKVAERGKVGKRILFQGAVAFNDAVVAALEKETGQTLRVTPNNELTGCIGAAMLARDAGICRTRFRGFREIAERNYEQSVFTCNICENRCDVRKVVVEGRAPLFYGDRCDRYQGQRLASPTERRAASTLPALAKTLASTLPQSEMEIPLTPAEGRKGEGSSSKQRKISTKHPLPDLFEERAKWLLEDYAPEPSNGPVVGIPLAMSFLEVMPYWRTFLRELGARTVLSGNTTRRLIERSSDYVATEACMPVKAAHGHLLELIDSKPDFIFLPTLTDRQRPKDERTHRYNCPFAQVWGHVVRAGLDPRQHGIQVLEPIVFNALGKRFMCRELRKVADALGASSRRLARAQEAAEAAQAEFGRRLLARGRQILADLPGGRGVVVTGRPYNACDTGMNLDLPKKLRRMDVLPIPMDMLPLEHAPVLERWKNMYWNYGRLILAGGMFVADDERLDLIHVTNFRCGPDSFLVKYLPDAMQGKPYLMLEFDDHSADAGVVTRIEAYLDSRRSRARAAYAKPPRVITDRVRKRTVYMPHMGDMMYGVAAACRGFGIYAEVIPTDAESLKHGSEFTSGRECLPFILCVGNMVKTVRRPDFDAAAAGFFMASCSGPCRFGQYEYGMRLVLDELGHPEVPIFSLNQSAEVLGQLPGLRFVQHAYWGLAAVNEIQRLARQIRPYEAEAGTTDRVYRQALDDVCAALEARHKPLAALEEAARNFRDIPKLPLDKPRVLVVGESYVRMQPFANCNIVEKIEALGGEAWVPTFLEWVHHVNLCMRIYTRENRLLWQRAIVGLTEWAMHRIEHAVGRALRPAFRDTYVPSIEALWQKSAETGFVPHFGDASLAVGLARDMSGRGIDGVVNIMPFTCMVGSVARSQLRRAADMLGGAPVLDVEFDGRGDELLRDELEMFMEQVKERHRLRTSGAHVAAASSGK